MNLENKKIWLCADFHFGHHKIIEYCNRPFKNTTEMNNTLIKNFNNVVGKNDVVFILGDLSWLNRKSTTQIVKSLNGFKYLIKGNHDRKGNQYYRDMGFMEVYDHPIFLNKNVVLSHEPINIKDAKIINIHGHTHHLDSGFGNGNNISVSVEKTNYRPVLLNNYLEFLEYMNVSK
ncbi:MAG: phosphoesterase [Staphylococcus sp.]|nr:phosphoesterase [Staphylococcus sp.]